MDPEIKAKWVTALRSGNYQQGTGQLRISRPARVPGPDKFCCLGVLCDLIEPHALVARGRLAGAQAPRGHTASRQWRSWPTLGSPHSRTPRILCDTLVTMNDDDRATFEQIADWIEANL